MDYPTKRDILGHWLNDHNLLGEGVEVGSAWGSNATDILSHWKGKRLYMVDPWIMQDPGVYREEQNHTTNWLDWYQVCLRMSIKDPRALPMRLYSNEALPLFADNSLSFVYLDGNHAYKPFLDDLDWWWPKVQPGGLFGGHDYYDCTVHPHWCEVKSALDRWTKEKGLTFSTTPCSSWWILKK